MRQLSEAFRCAAVALTWQLRQVLFERPVPDISDEFATLVYLYGTLDMILAIDAKGYLNTLPSVSLDELELDESVKLMSQVSGLLGGMAPPGDSFLGLAPHLAEIDRFCDHFPDAGRVWDRVQRSGLRREKPQQFD